MGVGGSFLVPGISTGFVFLFFCFVLFCLLFVCFSLLCVSVLHAFLWMLSIFVHCVSLSFISFVLLFG